MNKVVGLALVLFLSIFVLMPIPDFLVDTHVPKMINHSLYQTIHIQLPPSIRVFETSLSEHEQLLYSAYMINDEQSFQGYIQVWQLDDVESFLVNSKNMSTYDFYTYSINKITLGNLSGQLNVWGASFGELTHISGKEYWLRKPGSSEVLRIAFLTSNPTFSEEKVKMMNRVLSTLRWESLSK